MSEKLILKCKNCGIEFKRFASEQVKNRDDYNTYCSFDCFKKSPIRRKTLSRLAIARTKVPKIEMSPIDIGYMAGCIDGEGSFNITPGANKAYNVSVFVANTDHKMLDKLYEMSGVGVVYSARYNRRERNTLWIWSICSRVQLSILLPIIIPALITKRKQAEYVLEFCERRIASILTDEKDIKLRELVQQENRKKYPE